MDIPKVHARWDLMPPELWYLAVENLPVEDILNLCRTSKEFAGMCEDNHLWKFLLKRDYNVVRSLDKAKEKYISLVRFGPMVSCGGGHTAAVTKEGKLYMWGHNLYGQLGNGTDTDKNKPILIKGLTCVQVSCGKEHTGAVTEDGKLYIWGLGDWGQLGIDKVFEYTPYPVMGGITQVSCGRMHTGAVTAGGLLYMWGENRSGQIGAGEPYGVTHRPFPVIGDIAQVSCGGNHTGAITTEGELYMWGGNGYGQLGDGTKDNKKRPTLIKIEGNPQIIQISCGGDDRTGAVTAEGKLYMWGNIYSYVKPTQNTPLLIMDNVVQVSCGDRHTGALMRDGSLCMWGSNRWGQLGDGTEDSKKNPTFIMKGITQVSCGRGYTGAVTKLGKIYMWGENSHSKLGDGTTINKNKPTIITLPTKSSPIKKKPLGKNQ